MKRSAVAMFDPFNVSVPTEAVNFYEPQQQHEEEPILVESTIYPKSHTVIDNDLELLYNDDAKKRIDVLRWLRYRVKLLLDPLYVFVGMIESGLGGTSTAYQYAWKTGVHSAKQIENMTQIYTRHPHLDKHWIDDAFILYKYSTAMELGKTEHAGKTPKKEEEKIDQFIGVDCAPYVDDINVITAEKLYKLFETVMGNVTMGVIEMCVAELNDSIGRDFTPIELMLSPSVRGMFARFVASRIEAGRESAPPAHGQAGNWGRYILAPSYKQKTAMSKWGIGLKLWFKNVYRQENPQYKQDIERMRRNQENLINIMIDADPHVQQDVIIDIIEAVSRALLPCLLVHHNKPAF